MKLRYRLILEVLFAGALLAYALPRIAPWFDEEYDHPAQRMAEQARQNVRVVESSSERQQLQQQVDQIKTHVRERLQKAQGRVPPG